MSTKHPPEMPHRAHSMKRPEEDEGEERDVPPEPEDEEKDLPSSHGKVSAREGIDEIGGHPTPAPEPPKADATGPWGRDHTWYAEQGLTNSVI